MSASQVEFASLTIPLMKFRYFGIMSLKSSVMKTLLTNSCDRKKQSFRNRVEGNHDYPSLKKGTYPALIIETVGGNTLM